MLLHSSNKYTHEGIIAKSGKKLFQTLQKERHDILGTKALFNSHVTINNQSEAIYDAKKKKKHEPTKRKSKESGFRPHSLCTKRDKKEKNNRKTLIKAPFIEFLLAA